MYAVSPFSNLFPTTRNPFFDNSKCLYCRQVILTLHAQLLRHVLFPTMALIGLYFLSDFEISYLFFHVLHNHSTLRSKYILMRAKKLPLFEG